MSINPRAVKYPSGPNCEGCPFRATSVGFTVTQGIQAQYEGDRWLKYQPGPLFASAEYMFVADKPGLQETKTGHNQVGQTGQTFNMLLHNNTPLIRAEVVVSSCVKCRPIKWKSDGEGGQEPYRQPNGDFVNDTPSPEQVNECRQRYLQEELDAFAGGTIVGLGAGALRLFAGRPISLGEGAGTIFEHGSMVPCKSCAATGMVSGGSRKCPMCADKKTTKCSGCRRWTKHTKSCPENDRPFSPCAECAGEGKVAKPPKVCKNCKGNKEVPSDPEAPYVSQLLREGQLFFPNYHPTYLFQAANERRNVARTFSRIVGLRKELVVEDATEYVNEPSDALVDEVFKANQLSVDLETTGLDCFRGEIQIFSASDRPGRSITPDIEYKVITDWLQAAAEGKVVVVGQNWILFDSVWVKHHWDIDLPEECLDTLLMAHLLDPDSPKKLPSLVQQYAIPPIRGYWKTRDHYRSDKKRVANIDTDGAGRAASGQVDELTKEGRMHQYWDEVLPVAKEAARMQLRGWRVDRDALKVAGDKVNIRLEARRKELPEWPASASGKWKGQRTENQTEWVKSYAYDTLKLPVLLNRQSKNPSFGSEQRKELDTRLRTGHPSVWKLSSLEIDQALNYIELIDSLKDDGKLMTFLNPDSKYLYRSRFHPSWNPAGTATYRFSCAEPNLQQVPKCGCGKAWNDNCYGKNPLCTGARFPFLPSHEGWELCSIDYSQVEVVGFLWTAGEWEILRRVLFEGLDAHEVMADQLNMIRKEAKHMTFALVYGASDELIAAKSGNSVAAVAVARQHYLKTFPGVERFRKRYIYQAMNEGYVENVFERRRYLWVRSPIGRAANQAANAPIQGIPPMVVRRAMIRMAAQLPHPAHILGNIHDELILSYPKEMRDEVLTCAQDLMRAPVPEMPAAPLGMAGGLVLNIEAKVGDKWSQLKR